MDESSHEREDHGDPVVVLGLLARGSSVLGDGPDGKTAVERHSEEVVDIVVEASRDAFTGEGSRENKEEGVEEEHERGVLEPIDGLRVGERVLLQDREDHHSADKFDEEEQSAAGAAFFLVERHTHD